MTEIHHSADDYSAPLVAFLESKRTNEWLKYDDGLEVYVRKSSRLDNLQVYRSCVDVANMSLPKSSRGKGYFTSWIKMCEQQADTRDLHVYVENLLNTRLAHFFYRRGYHMVSNACNIPCLMRRPNQDKEWLNTPRRIVCAALWKNWDMIVGPRHYDSVMRSQISMTKQGEDYWCSGVTQGFVDQMGHFYDRKAAWKLAEANGQIVREVSTPGTLYSENLY